MSLAATAAVTALGAACAGGTLWLARRAERASTELPAAPEVDADAAPDGPWWEAEPWWAALSPDERRWVVRNLADAGHAPGTDVD